MKTNYSQYLPWINAIIFVSSLIAVSVAFVIKPTQAVSIEEKRVLATYPVWLIDQVKSGRYFKDVDFYVADHFILRHSSSELAGMLQNLRGFVIDDIKIVAPVNGHHNSQPASDDNQRVSVNSASPAATSSRSTTAAGARLDALNTQKANVEIYQNIESIIIYKGRALQMVGGGGKQRYSFANTINDYKLQFGNAVNLFVLVAPIGADFYLPHKLNRSGRNEINLINTFYEQINDPVIKVDAYSELEPHKDAYLYFNTDHHWTGLGAYYAFCAFAKAAHFESIPLESLERHVIPHFLGSLYQLTQAPELKQTGDQVEYYMIPNKTNVSIFGNDGERERKTQLYATYAQGPLAYGVFLGGDFPLMKINSDVGTKEKIVVIKDSYGNAFVPYLASHYSEVYVIDYRYYKGNLKKLVKDNGVQNILFVHNTFVIQSRYTATQAQSFLKN
jgi:DHHW protein